MDFELIIVIVNANYSEIAMDAARDEGARGGTIVHARGTGTKAMEEKYGIILRAKGIVPATDGTWIHFDYVPGEPDVRTGSAATIGRLCVIGSKIAEKAIAELFGA